MKYNLYSIMRGLLGSTNDEKKMWRMIGTHLHWGETYHVLDENNNIVLKFVPY